jgi:rhamnulokinase
VASHETASAVTGIPSDSSGRAYFFFGVFTVLGIESDVPVITIASMRDNFSNEIGVGNKIRFLKYLRGLELIKSLSDHWSKEDKSFDCFEIIKLAQKSEKIESVVDLDSEDFISTVNPTRIQEYCRKSGQKVPVTKGEILLVAFQSLAANYKIVFDQLNGHANNSLKFIHVIGDGSANDFLCQYLADIINLEVISSAMDATAMGNVIMQMIAMQGIESIHEGRRIISASTVLKMYKPNHDESFDKFVLKLKSLINEAGR